MLFFSLGLTTDVEMQNGCFVAEPEYDSIVPVFLAGFSLGLSLIVAVGAQNAFVLRQGLIGQHVFWVSLVCALSDAVLIFAGVFGFSVFVGNSPEIVRLSKYLAAAFLIVLGALSLRSAAKGGLALSVEKGDVQSLRSCLITVLLLTWLNPHVYLETVILVGAVSTEHTGQEIAFGLGAALASFVFFFLLGYGARILQPWFATARSWQALYVIFAGIMWAIAASLILD